MCPKKTPLVPAGSSKPGCEHHDFSDPTRDPDQETLEMHQARLLFRSQAFLDATDPMLVEDLEGCLIDMNKATERDYGWKREELLGKPVRTLTPESRHGEQIRDLRARCLAGETVRDVEGERQSRSGGRIPVLLTLSVARSEAGEPAAFISVAKDQRENIRLKRQRAAAQRAAQRAEEEERRSLATDLHDALGQLLALGRMQLGRLATEVKEPPALARIEEIQGLLAQMDEQVRTLQFRLSPHSLYDLGLGAAAEQLAEDIERGFGLCVEVRSRGVESEPAAPGPRPPLTDDVATALFRCLRELLINAARHSESNRAVVEISWGKPGLVRVEVRDGGAGFDPEEPSSSGFGLMSVRERLESVEGRLEIESQPGSGTRVRMVAPLRQAEPQAEPQAP